MNDPEDKKNLSKLIGSDFIYKNPLDKWKTILLNHNGEHTNILNLGSGSYILDKKALNVDIVPFKNVDVIADAHKLPFKNETFDTVWCDAVLEHVHTPIKVVSEIYRVLKKGGYVFAVIPFIHKYHDHPNDFQRYTKTGIEKLFSKFRKQETGVYRGATSALTSFLSEYFSLFFTSPKLANITRGIILLLLYPMRIFERFLIKKERSHELANALYYIGKKEE